MPQEQVEMLVKRSPQHSVVVRFYENDEGRFVLCMIREHKGVVPAHHDLLGGEYQTEECMQKEILHRMAVSARSRRRGAMG